MLQAIRNWFRAVFSVIGTRQTIWEPVFVPTNIREVDDNYGFSKQAARWATRNLPSLTDAEPDAGHKAIYAHFHQLALALHPRALKRLQEYKALRPSIHPDTYVARIRSTPSEFSQTAAFEVANHQSQLKELSDDALASAQHDYQLFRKANRVDREPDYPDSHVIFFAVPAVLLAFDVLFNAFVFSTATEGLRGGIKIALILALVNIVVSGLLGRSLRYINRYEWYWKSVGFLCGVLLLLYFPLNLFVARFRDAAFALQDIHLMTLEQAIERQKHLFPDAVERFLHSPFRLESTESVGLLILGVAFAALAATDGYKSDDPVPGLSKLHRRMEQIRELIKEVNERFYTQLNQQKDSALNALAAVQNEFAESYRAFTNYHSLCEIVANVYEKQCTDYCSAYEALIQTYRAENRLARMDGSSPAYFSQPPVSLAIPGLKADLSQDEAVIQAYQEIAKQLTIHLGKAQSEIHQQWIALSAHIPNRDLHPGNDSSSH